MALNKQVWVSQIKEGFYPDTSFLRYFTDFSHAVNADKIHIPSAGIDPNVLINNTTYPITINQRTDTDCEITLDKFETENTLIRRPEVIEYSYDQLESVIRQHRNTLMKATGAKAAHATAPQTNTTNTPVILTTGATDNGRKRLKFADILSLKVRFDEADVPLEERYLVLHPKHVTDLLLEDINLFKDLTNIVDGVPTRFGGFYCLSFSKMPTYTISETGVTKVAYTGVQTNNFASFAFHGGEVMKADGEVFMYSRENDPEERATIVGFDKRFIAMPIRNIGVGAIVSANAN